MVVSSGGSRDVRGLDPEIADSRRGAEMPIRFHIDRTRLWPERLCCEER
jgi:hypothetical protein